MRRLSFRFLLGALFACLGTALGLGVGLSPASAQTAPLQPLGCGSTPINDNLTFFFVEPNFDDPNVDRFVFERSLDNGTWFWAGRITDGVSTEFQASTPLPISRYRFRVFAVSADGTRSPARNCFDPPAPIVNVVAPVSCSVVQVGDDLRVSWVRDPNDEGTSFVVFIATGNQPANVLDFPSGLSLDFRTGTPGTSYRFLVSSTAAPPNETSRRVSCNPSPIVLRAEQAPATPSSCFVDVTSASSVRLSIGSAARVQDFVVRRSRNGGPFFWAGLSNDGAFSPINSFFDSGIRPGTYRYTVTARNSAGSSAPRTCGPTNGVTLGSSSAAPRTVVSCWATKASNGSIRITWTRAPGDNATRFVVQRQRNGGAWFWAGRTDPATSWVNSGVRSGTYKYRVITKNGNASSSAKNCGPSAGVTL